MSRAISTGGAPPLLVFCSSITNVAGGHGEAGQGGGMWWGARPGWVCRTICGSGKGRILMEIGASGQLVRLRVFSSGDVIVSGQVVDGNRCLGTGGGRVRDGGDDAGGHGETQSIVVVAVNGGDRVPL